MLGQVSAMTLIKYQSIPLNPIMIACSIIRTVPPNPYRRTVCGRTVSRRTVTGRTVMRRTFIRRTVSRRTVNRKTTDEVPEHPAQPHHDRVLHYPHGPTNPPACRSVQGRSGTLPHAVAPALRGVNPFNSKPRTLNLHTGTMWPAFAPYRGASLKRNIPLLGPYSRTTLRVP